MPPSAEYSLGRESNCSSHLLNIILTSITSGRYLQPLVLSLACPLSLMHSLTHALTHSLAHSLTCSLTYILTRSPTHSLTCSLTHSHTHSLTTYTLTLQVRTWKMNIYTVIQVVLIAALYGLKLSPAGMLYPLAIVLLIPIRMFMERFMYNHKEFEAVTAASD